MTDHDHNDATATSGVSDRTRQLRQAIIEGAAANEKLLDQMSDDQIEQLIKASEIVAGVYPEPTSEDGVGIYLIKGCEQFAAVRDKLSIDGVAGSIIAVPCGDADDAVGLQLWAGDPFDDQYPDLQRVQRELAAQRSQQALMRQHHATADIAAFIVKLSERTPARDRTAECIAYAVARKFPGVDDDQLRKAQDRFLSSNIRHHSRGSH